MTVGTLRRVMLFGWLFASALGVTLPAQAPHQVGLLPDGEPAATTFKSTVDLVTLNVTVTDRRNKPVPGLGRDDFRVLEDGVPQELSFFAASEVPIDVALLIDASSSMQDKIQEVRQAAEGFINTLRPMDRGAVMSFATQFRVVQGFTNDQAALRTAVRSVVPKGSTALYTALYIALDRFQKEKQQEAADGKVSVRRPAIVVLTDGADTSSLIQFDDMLERARRAGVAIYPISIVSEYQGTIAGDRRAFGEPDYALKTLARETGAQAFFPTQLTDLNGVYQSVAQELSEQYALGYVPKVERRDGGFRRLVVQILNVADARPRTRTGYYASGPIRAAR